MSPQKNAKFTFIPNKEQGQNESKRVSLLSIHRSRHEEDKFLNIKSLNHQTISLLGSQNNASNRVKLVKTKKFKSSADNQPFLISAGLLALGNKNKSDAKKPKRC